MNINTLKKYWKELEHYKNGGSLYARIWFSDPNDGDTCYSLWYEVGSEDWDIDKVFNYDLEYTKVQITINDKYVEFRKALAEGKTLQLNDGDKFVKNWSDAYPNKTPLETYPVHCYRIKPEEPQFKVGDWVRITYRYDESIKNTIQQFHSSSEIKHPDKDENVIRTNFIRGHFNYVLSDRAIVEPWKPQPGELVILKNKNGIISVIKYNGEPNVYPFIGEITWLHKKD